MIALGDDRPAVTLASPSSPLVALRLVFRAGSQNDPKGKEGLAALTASMIAQGGSKSLSYEQILKKFYPISASADADCLKEVTVFSGLIHRDNLGKYVPILAEMIAEPRFAPEDFERLRNEAVDEVTKYLRGNNDEELGKWTLQTALYRDHPYGHPDRGTEKGLKSITLDDVKQFHKKHYSREALTLGLAGGYGADDPAKVEGLLARLPGEGLSIPDLPAPRRPRGLDVTIVRKPADASAISIGFPIDVTRADDDFYALAVANSYLGEHRTFNGKLMKDLRGKRGLNYGDYSYIEDFIQEGQSTFAIANNPRRQQYFSIWQRPVPKDKAIFALRGALWEFDRLVEKGLSPEDFEATRTFLINYSKLWGQTLSRRLGYAIDGSFHGREDLITELARRLPKLTVDQVNAAVRKHLRTDGMKVAIVAENADELKEILLSGKPTPIGYDTEGTPEDVLAEDKEIANFPLKDVSVTIVPVEKMFEE
jgi:zinc protease